MEKGLVTQTATPATLLEMAIQKGVDITQLKELMDLQERWEKKEAKKSFLDALSRFQTIVPALNKSKTAKIPTKTGGQFSYNYADLGTIAGLIKAALNECGLSYRWEFEENNERMKVTCLVSHRDGHTETTSMTGLRDNSGSKNDIQQKGSTNTYLQRYTLIGALGLSTADTDNDGKTAPGKAKDKEKDLSAAEVLELWKTTINETKTRIELQSLYMKNRKVVDDDPTLQDLFKERQEKLKSATPAKTVLP